MNKKVKLLMLVVIILSVIFTGCYDSVEIDDDVFPVMIGVDKGVNNKIRLTIQYPTYETTANAGGSNSEYSQPGSNVHMIETPTIIEGVDMFGMAISRKVSLKHLKTIVFSEDLAREGLKYYVAEIEKYRHIRSSMLVVVVKGKAEDFLKANKSNIGESIAKANELLFLQSSNNNYYPFVKFYNFNKAIVSNYEQSIAMYAGVNYFNNLNENIKGNTSPLITDNGFSPGKVPRIGVAKREIVGTAVFDGDRMVGYLDSYETRFYKIIKGDFQRGEISIEDRKKPGAAIVVNVKTMRKPKIKAYFINGKPVIDVNLKVDADLEAVQSRIDYEDIHMINDLNNEIRDFLLKGINHTIEKTQNEYGTDIFGFGYYVANNFSTIPEWESYNWLKHYPEAKINISLDIIVRRPGITFKSTKVWNSKGKE
jgi:spore germination protein KC